MAESKVVMDIQARVGVGMVGMMVDETADHDRGTRARRKSKNFEELRSKFEPETTKGGWGDSAGFTASGTEGVKVKPMNRNKDPFLGKIWDTIDDIKVKKTAMLKVLKKWEILKLCKNVIDENEELIESMSMKERLKENVSWKENERNEYIEWKARNIRFMTLKTSTVTEKVSCGPLDQFLKKENWEMVVKKYITEKESLHEELSCERKSKSKKKRLELLYFNHLSYQLPS